MNKDKILQEVEQTLSVLDNEMIPLSRALNLDKLELSLGTSKQHGRLILPEPGKIILLATILINLFTLYFMINRNHESMQHSQLLHKLKNDLQIEQSINLF